MDGNIFNSFKIMSKIVMKKFKIRYRRGNSNVKNRSTDFFTDSKIEVERSRRRRRRDNDKHSFKSRKHEKETEQSRQRNTEESS